MVVALVAAACTKSDDAGFKDSADLIVYGKIYTAQIDSTKSGDAQYVMAQAMVIKDGKYIYVGDKAGADAYKATNYCIVDSGFITPSFTDGHAHYLSSFADLQFKDSSIEFDTEDSYEQVLEKLRAFVAQAQKNGTNLEFIFGKGYNWGFWSADGSDVRDRADLDSIVSDIPVFLVPFDQHSCWVNTRAMINAGILDERGNVIRDSIAGGFIGQKNGRFTGTFYERATSLLVSDGLSNKRRMTLTQATNAVKDAQDYLLSVGITNSICAWSNYFGADDEVIYQGLVALENNGDLHMHYSMAFEIEPWFNNNNPFKYVDKAIEIKQKYSGYKHIHPEYLKLFMDGSIELGTGFVLTPYNDQKDSVFSGHGTALWSLDDAKAIVAAANKAGLTVHTHTMGDGASHRMVQAYSQAGSKEMRNCLAHLRSVSPDDYAVIKANDIACTSNFNWHIMRDADRDIYKQRLQEPYCSEAYPLKSFFDNGILMSGCTDTPADDGINYPLECMQIAVTGTSQKKGATIPWWEDEIINRYQALQTLTYNGAWQLHLEKQTGSIEVGKSADFLILDTDVLTCDANQIMKTQVLCTFFEGEEVYTNPQPSTHGPIHR